MSGEFISGTYTGYDFKECLWDAQCTGYQKGSVNRYVCNNAEEFDSEKILTPTKTEKLLNKYGGEIEEYVRFQKYDIGGLKLGVTEFTKLKPEYTDIANPESYRAKKEEKLRGYIVMDGREEISTFYPTKAQAKKRAMELSVLRGKELVITKTYGIPYGRTTKIIAVGYVQFKETGSYKTKPKTTPKGIVIKPKYLFVYSGVVSDHEYEYM